MSSELFSTRAADKVQALIEAEAHDPSAPRGGKRPYRDQSLPPPRRGILLQGLAQSGSQVDMALTALTVPPPNGSDPFGFKVTILGNPSFTVGSTFTLTFTAPGGSPQTTAAIAYNASAATVQAALQKLSSIGTDTGNVTVSLGALAAGVSSSGAPAEFPGVWIIRFAGKFLQGTKPQAPTLTGTASFTGISALSVAAETFLDTGAYAPVTCLVPIGNPSPLNAGSVVFCKFVPGIGYCVDAAEPRFFTAPGYS